MSLGRKPAKGGLQAKVEAKGGRQEEGREEKHPLEQHSHHHCPIYNNLHQEAEGGLQSPSASPRGWLSAPCPCTWLSASCRHHALPAALDWSACFFIALFLVSNLPLQGSGCCQQHCGEAGVRGTVLSSSGHQALATNPCLKGSARGWE